MAIGLFTLPMPKTALTHTLVANHFRWFTVGVDLSLISFLRKLASISTSFYGFVSLEKTCVCVSLIACFVVCPNRHFQLNPSLNPILIMVKR